MPTINNNNLNAFRNYRPEGPAAHALTDAEKVKTVDNNVSAISFFKDSGITGAKAYLVADPSPANDVGRLAKIFDQPAADLDAVKTDPKKFEALLKSTVDAKKTYFNPTFGQLEGAPTRFKFNNIVGQRVDQFANEALKLAEQLYPSGDNRDAALRAANLAVRDLMNRSVAFDEFEVNGYASFGHDATFIHVYEKKLAELEKIDQSLLTPDQKTSVERQKKQLQGEIDDIFRHKYVYENSNMQETDAEKTIGLVAIDKVSRQRISETKDTADGIVPAFERLSLDVSGETKGVFFDAKKNKYFFDGTTNEVPANQVANLTRNAVSDSDVTFRRAKAGEQLREGFRLDWDQSGYVQTGNIDWVGWAGHCNDKAALEAAGLVLPADHAGVYEYNSASGSKAHYNRDLLNEITMSFSELGSEMSKKTGGQAVKDLGATEFASARDDDRPDVIDLGNGRTIPFNARPNEFTMTKVVKDGKTYEAAKAFSEYIVADNEMSATKNPLFKSTSEGDYVGIGLANATIEANVKLQVFDEATGYPTMKSSTIKIDFANPPADPILVDTLMADAAKREMYEIHLDVGAKQWTYQKIRMEKQSDGKYARVKVGAEGKEAFDPAKLTGKRETSLDNPATYLPFVNDAMRTGRNATAETADGSGVWNGRIRNLGMTLEKREGDWERVAVNVSARYGGNNGRFLAHLDKTGKPDFFVPLAMPADFWWRSKVTFAPEAEGLVNTTGLERGAVTVQGSSVHTDALSDMMEVLHCAYNNRPYTIMHGGQRFFFDTKEAWEAEIAKLDQLRAAIATGTGGGGGGGTTVNPAAELIKVDAAKVNANDLKTFNVTVEADGKLVVALDTDAGDADLYVKKGEGAGPNAYDAKSWETDTSLDKLELDVKAGETYSIAVHGYKASDFNLMVTGPKVTGTGGGGTTSDLVNVKKSGSVAKNELQKLETIEVKADGVLKFKMSGTGDADLYVKKNGEVSKSSWDVRPYADGSAETGELPVKKGDKVNVMVHGYSAATFDLEITQ
ncbi:MAG: PPC domain-containing protein [Deltaproteobacteria bacterium]|nr:PPC domain-containing protein [Deltaproteobacteria bacterium]